MKSARKLRFSSAATAAATAAAVTYTLPNDSPVSETPITVQLSPPQSHSSAATKIQSTYRAHLLRSLYKTISAVDSEAGRLQRLIQRQETVDSLRSSERERLRMNESLMALLLSLDAVPGGIDPAVREARRKVSRRIVGLQEIVDGICGSSAGGRECMSMEGYGWEWEEALWGMEAEVCRERGGEEMERFCAQYLGFRCLERFLRQP
ncbi:BAG family molecular chaperone regulator 5, mitochondrial [Punica granatum]|uniref:BAG domain-containing protein n=2 Tax=Punica granatum TaxID=22663 RepID=A0A218XMA6_PUNGR|nr:BAG family molecular chaperone regulator 5, mitochondrial [Punica granatum]OWM85611.1 hypothetical protein CDL15_Pgr029034 [Punica granatum]PKI37425.1 hypothetical protein CRG98_042211 [Punica granatum]